MTISAPPGVFDILPSGIKEPWKFSHLWQYVEGVIRDTARCYSFKEVRTPLFERTELFLRGVGEGTDVVSKEMYTFLDRGNRSMTLRPEGTAPVMRAFIEHSLQQQGSEQRLFYIAPMFRYERSQSGRYRQHHQFGVEAIGCAAPEQDAEVIDLLYTLYRRLQLKGLAVSINSIGTAQCRAKFRTALVDFFQAFVAQLSPDSQQRLQSNPLRILDSKDPADRALLVNAPSIQDYLSSEAKEHFLAVLASLDLLKIPYKITPQLVRGLDYYNKTVFEVVSGVLGAQDSIGGGGRYDGLLKTLGGPDLPTFGFGTGIERIIQTMIGQQIAMPAPPSASLYIIPMGEAARAQMLLLAQRLRQAGISVQMDLAGRKVGKAMQLASQLGVRYVIVVGERELESGVVELKEMATGSVQPIAFHLLETFIQEI